MRVDLIGCKWTYQDAKKMIMNFFSVSCFNMIYFEILKTQRVSPTVYIYPSNFNLSTVCPFNSSPPQTITSYCAPDEIHWKATMRVFINIILHCVLHVLIHRYVMKEGKETQICRHTEGQICACLDRIRHTCQRRFKFSNDNPIISSNFHKAQINR